MGSDFRFIVLQHLHHNLVVAVHSGQPGRRPNTLRVEWGVATEYATSICGRGGENLARPRRGCAGGLHNDIFLAGGAGGELGRGASSMAAVASEGWRRAKVGFGDGFALPSEARPFFQRGARCRRSRYRVLPRRDRSRSTGYLFGIQRMPA
jgi:hypothetical protein